MDLVGPWLLDHLRKILSTFWGSACAHIAIFIAVEGLWLCCCVPLLGALYGFDALGLIVLGIIAMPCIAFILTLFAPIKKRISWLLSIIIYSGILLVIIEFIITVAESPHDYIVNNGIDWKTCLESLEYIITGGSDGLFWGACLPIGEFALLESLRMCICW